MRAPLGVEKKDLYVFFSVVAVLFFPWFIYFGEGRFCSVGDAAALEKRQGWQLGSPLPSRSAPR